MLTLSSHLRRHWPIVAIGAVTALILSLPSLTALAQDLPTAPTTPNPNNPTLVAWSLLATTLLSALLKALSPGNSTLPPELSPKVLHLINVGGGVLTTCLLGIEGGTPWPQAILAGLLPIVVGLVQVGAAKSAWIAMLENAILPMEKRVKAANVLKRAIPMPPVSSTSEVK